MDLLGGCAIQTQAEARAITLRELKAEAALADMLLVRRGNRLSVTPVSGENWKFILGRE
jgi:predicted RNA-binding protein with PUA-like domain